MPLDRLPGWLNPVACGLLLLLLHVQGQVSDSPIRTTHTGQVRGSLIHVKDQGDVYQFLGIPFAKPPVGPLRFAPPESAEPWSGVRDGTSQPAICLQNTDIVKDQGPLEMFLIMPSDSMSEDCLYLNIYTPAHAHEGSNLPVMVWIHGGGLVAGAASQYDGATLAATEDVVVVLIQYRLGVLGFFSTGDLHASGNWGYLDQVAALRWVQQNIAHFGGDPDRVTIFGASGGGTSVSSHVVSPLSQGLFHGAIMQSGVALMPVIIADTFEVVYRIVVQRSGCEATDSEALVRCLRGKSEEEILAINKVFKIIPGVVDGKFLPRHPQELLASGDFHPVPSIIGVNSDEYGWILPTYLGTAHTIEEMTRENLQTVLKSTAAQMRLPPECGALLMEEYMGDTKDAQTLQLQYKEMMADFMFVIPALQVAHFQRSHAPVYFYEFQHPLSVLKNLRPPHMKADHCEETPFLFGSYLGLKIDLSEEEKLLSNKIMKYWANFARHGNPNSDGLPYWPKLDQSEQYLKLDIDPAVGHPLKAGRRLQFWTKTLPQKIQKLNGTHNQHREL